VKSFSFSFSLRYHLVWAGQDEGSHDWTVLSVILYECTVHHYGGNAGISLFAAAE
jgi:hypothetical protein